MEAIPDNPGNCQQGSCLTSSSCQLNFGQPALLRNHKELELLIVNQALNVLSAHSGTAPKQCDRLIREYPQMFEGVGKLANFEENIHIDDSVQPVVLPHRQVHFHLRQRLATEIKRFEDLDIIEHVSGPTPSISPVIAVERNSAEIRLCIDMRQANMAVKREGHPGPTLNNLVSDLNGVTVFSTIDMREGYNQIELVIEGIHGVRNVSDDIIIFGKTQSEHGTSLLFHRLSTRGLTLRREKLHLYAD